MLNMNIQYLKGVGEKRAVLLNKLGIFTVEDLLCFYPRAYADWRNVLKIKDAPFDENCCVRVILDHKPNENHVRKGMTLYKSTATDGESVMQLTLFNNKYLAQSLEAGEEYLLYGKMGGSLHFREMNSPEIKKAGGADKIHAIYPQTLGLSTRMISQLVQRTYSQYEKEIEETLPRNVIDDYALMSRRDAIKNIHFPQNDDYMLEARRRLIFEELLTFQLGLMKLRMGNKKRSGVKISTAFSDEFFLSLPFTPTNAQRRCVQEAESDMRSGTAMNRLLQGDVGSGKTVVAAAQMYTAVKNSYQCALMVPTEILALQHFKTLTSLLKDTGIKVRLLTGSLKIKEKNEIKKALESGEIDIIIGTHALIQKDVIFKNLGLVVTDEQHRFGVNQRMALGEKGDGPHVLVMSATPIPRTLALILYGDLDVSVIDELPPGRQKIESYVINSPKRKRAYTYIKKHLDDGRQGYIVCPLIEENEAQQLIAAETYFEQLASDDFKDYNLGLLHGKMKPGEKENVMNRFVSGEVQLLVSTTVIEVGVDVPNANIMVIENAERFGLSQLHQLRGRIGRGEHSSTCIFITDARNEETRRRMKIMISTTDGFKISEEDLKMRGPGDILGSKQHGLPEMKIADLATNADILVETRACAEKIIKNDPKLESAENACIRIQNTDITRLN